MMSKMTERKMGMAKRPWPFSWLWFKRPSCCGSSSWPITALAAAWQPDFASWLAAFFWSGLASKMTKMAWAESAWFWWPICSFTRGASWRSWIHISVGCSWYCKLVQLSRQFVGNHLHFLQVYFQFRSTLVQKTHSRLFCELPLALFCYAT